MSSFKKKTAPINTIEQGYSYICGTQRLFHGTGNHNLL